MDERELLGDLDADQRHAVTTASTLVAVIASAGSGKTRVLSRRIAYRVTSGTADARHTLALTFTREAAGELRRRLRRSGLRDGIEAGTFHSVALKLLRQRWADLGRRPSTVVGDPIRLLSVVAGNRPTEVLETERKWAAARGVVAVDYVDAAKAAKRSCPVPLADVAAALTAYETVKRTRGVIDLDDLVLMLDRELANDRSFEEVARWRFRHVLVDEAQDLNPVQYRLLRRLTAGGDDLFLVGDPAQAIYAFNGSDPTLLIDVEGHLPGIEIVRLGTNRRCTPQIVAAGMHVLRTTGQSADSVSGEPDGHPVEVVVAADEADEASRIAAILRSMPVGDLRAGSVAVLARTHEQLTRLRRRLTEAGVPVQQPGISRGSPMAAAIDEATTRSSAAQLRDWTHDVLERQPQSSTAGRLAEADQAERSVATATLEFLREEPQGDGHALRSWIATTKPFTSTEPGGVEVLTFHAAKGREWSTVVVAGVETSLVPHRSATTADALAEEARLLHVALTRAADRLIITRAERRRGYARKPSPFIVGMPIDAPPVVPPPPALHPEPDPIAVRVGSLSAWRRSAAKATAMLPDHVCSDADLVAIATHPPTTPAELSAVTGFGPITAARLFDPIRAALDDAGNDTDERHQGGIPR